MVKVVSFFLVALMSMSILAACRAPRTVPIPQAKGDIPSALLPQALLEETEAAPLSPQDQAQEEVIAIVDEYNRAFSEGDAATAFPFHVSPDRLKYYMGRCAFIPLGRAKTVEEMLDNIREETALHGRILRWDVGEQDWKYKPEEGGGWYFVVVDVWRTYDTGYRGKFEHYLVQRDSTYYIIGVTERDY